MATKEEEYIPGRMCARKHLGRVLVLGFGVSGQAVVRYLTEKAKDRFDEVVVLAGPSNAKGCQVAQEFAAPEVRFLFDDVNAPGFFDLCIASPGISPADPLYANARKVSDEVVSEVEFAWRESPVNSRWVAITGTNGKTTTTALTAQILKDAHFDAEPVGNIGQACITAVGNALNAAQGTSEHSEKVFVCEASSFQLESCCYFAPDVAIVLGITPDHLAWHGTYEDYQRAKWNILERLSDKADALAVLDATNDVVRAKVRELKAQSEAQRGFGYIPIGTAEGVRGDMRATCGALHAAFVDEADALHIALGAIDGSLVSIHDLGLAGSHNYINALAAASAALHLGADIDSVAATLKTFKPLEHRIEPAGEVNGIRFFDDSKATNVDATLVGVKAFLPIRPIIMLGGKDKGTDLAPLVCACEDAAKTVICFGEAGERFFEALKVLIDKGITVKLVSTFDEAFAAALDCAQEGDVVLLSPACASFDEFSCFEERGQHFKELVAQLGSRR